MRQKFITKCDRGLLQNAPDFLLQNATALLQNATVLLQDTTVITKCDIYYKFRQYTRPYITYSKKLQQKLNMLDKFILRKTFELNNFSEILCQGSI